MQLITWNDFVKKSNSTKQPIGIAGISHEVHLKQGTDMTDPTFLLDVVDWNIVYCMWNNRYYFVTGKRVGPNNVFELQCSLDHLATFKNNVAGSTAYIKYASTGYNRKLIDNRIATISDCKTVEQNFPKSPIPATFPGVEYCTYVVTVQGGGVKADEEGGRDNNEHVWNTGNRVTYAFDYYGFLSFSSHFSKLSDIWDYFDADESAVDIPEMHKMIISVKMLPIRFDYIWNSDLRQGIYRNIYIGNKHFTLTDITIAGVTHSVRRVILPYDSGYHNAFINNSIEIPYIYNDWRDQPPYTTAALHLPFYGDVDFNLNDYLGTYSSGQNRKIFIGTTLDFITGELLYLLPHPDANITNQSYSKVYKTNIGVDFPLSSSTADFSSIISSLSSVITSASTMNYMGVVSSTLDLNKAFNQRSYNNFGGCDSIHNLIQTMNDTTIKLILYTHETNIDPLSVGSVIGIPVEKKDVIGNYSGYIQCVNASIDANIMETERVTVNNFLNGGFYYE